MNVSHHFTLLDNNNTFPLDARDPDLRKFEEN